MTTARGSFIRTFGPQRIPGKLGAYIAKGGRAWDARPGENVLYLGAAHGVTVTWVAEHAGNGTVVAIEKSPVASLDLLDAATPRKNLLPFVGDASRPASYASIVPPLGLVYQDVAQRDQVQIFLRNARHFRPRRGFIAIKARSIAVDKAPREVFDAAAAELQRSGADVVDAVVLDPFHKDHAMIVTDFAWEG